MTQSPVFVYDQLPEGYPTKAEATKFGDAYEPKFGLRSPFAAQVWDTMNILKIAVPKALKSGAKPGTVQFREALRSAIEETRGYKGTMAVFNFTPTDHTGVDQKCQKDSVRRGNAREWSAIVPAVRRFARRSVGDQAQQDQQPT